MDRLEPRSLMAANPIITEFLASNSSGLVDGNGTRPDWVEIYNAGDASIDLAGWHLSDTASNRGKWTFPSVTLSAGQYLVVAADSAATSGPDLSGYLHTNFSLSADGENLSLSDTNLTVVSQFGPNSTNYPAQLADTSYGTTKVLNNVTGLIGPTSPAKALVPTSNILDDNAWTQAGYGDSSWKSGVLGAGYDGGGTASLAGLLARWYAPSLAAGFGLGGTLNDNATIQTWSAYVGTGSAGQNTSNRRPSLQSDGGSLMGGKPVVRFDGNDNLLVTNQSLNGLSNFTVAMVFRTSTAGVNGTQWYNNTGIVDAEVGGVSSDWGLSINDAGSIGAGIGNPDSTLYSKTGLANGAAHTAVLTKTGTTYALSIDGAAPISGTVPAGARTVNELMFGSLHTNINYFNGDLGEVRLYNAALSDDSARSLSSELASTWGVTLAAGAFTSKIGLDLRTEMAGIASTAAIRVPFNVSNPSLYDTLTMSMKYDDGFVAYLNGIEVARRNAPGGAITYTTTAAGVRSDAAALSPESIDLSAFIGLLQNGSNVLAIRGLNSSVGDSDLLIAPELSIATSSVGPAYMTTPTPGVANAPGFSGLVSPVASSVAHGYYSAAFNTTLTTPTAGATLVYTLDGSVPTLTNGVQVTPPASGATSVTINISGSKVIRASAFKLGFLPSKVSATSYLFVNDIVQQPEYTPAGAYWDVGMDTDVVNAQQTYSVQQALTAIPTISMTIANDDMFGPSSGIYTHPLEEGDLWERFASIEYFDPNNLANQFTVNAGVRISGSVSRQTSRPKKGFKLYFRSEYGDSNLNFPIFGAANPQKVFEHLILRAGHNHSWANLGGTSLESGDYMRDEFARDTQKAITGKAIEGGWAQLYINGQYWGLYNTTEDLDPTWAEANYGGDEDEYDIVKPNDGGGVEADDGNLVAWNQLFADADAAYADGVIDNAEYLNLSGQVDTKNLVDYVLGIIYRGDQDGPVLIGSTTSPRNFIALHNRVDPSGKFIFQTQDGELSIDDLGFDRTEVFGNQNPGRLYQQLRTNGEFRQLVGDEIQRLFYNNGPLTVAQNQARYNAVKSQINIAIVGESARWGNAKQTQVAMRDTNWITETNWITNTYMVSRTSVVLTQLKNDFTLLNTSAPTVYVNGVATTGGTFNSGATVSLVDGNSPVGAVYYTLDGTDPRAVGGAVAPTAVPYSGAFPLTRAATLQARVLKNGVWSPLQKVALNVTPPSLRLSELMYHPPNPAAGAPYAKDDYEFIELANTGATPIDLGGMQLLTGVFGTIANGVTLAPGARGVIVKNLAAFQYIYGTAVQILGVYTDALSNGGEQLQLFDPNSGTDVFNFTYADLWQPTTDNGGFSMVVNDLGPSQAIDTVLGVAGAWRASLTIGGSPGKVETIGAVAGRNLFYNNSSFDGFAVATNANDDAAIATDKYPLYPGRAATFSNYSSYSKGINGVMIDVIGLNRQQLWALTAADFTFRVSDASVVPVWSPAPAGAVVTTRSGAGASGADRISITWPDGTIMGRWLEITLNSNARTALSLPDVFYFGNAAGDTGNSGTDAIVNNVDELAAHNNAAAAVTIASPYDFNRDGIVDAADELIAHNNGTTFATSLKLINAPKSPNGKTTTIRPGRDTIDNPGGGSNFASRPIVAPPGPSYTGRIDSDPADRVADLLFASA